MERLKRWLTRWLLRRARSVGDRPQGSSVGTFKQESAQVLEGDARLILESITDGFCAISTEWRFIYVNRKAEALLRRKPDDLLGKIIWDQYPGLVGTEFEAVCRRVANTRAVESHTAFYPEHDRWYETRVYPAEYGISIYFRDVSEEKRADQQLIGVIAESERQRLVYETALSNSADFNYVFDLEGRFTYVNKALLALWEKDLSDALGKNFFELDYPAELAARLQQQITQVIDTGQSLRDETPYTSAIGTRAYEYIFVPVTDTAGRVVAVTGSTRDITERKQAEETLRENDRRKDEFLATLAHELRNPLAPLRNGLEIVRLAAGNPKALEQARSMMERQLSHLVRLVDDLLDLSRISRGKVELRKERLPIASVVQQAVELSRPSIDQASQQLNLHVPASAMWIDADPTRLTQVLANLLDNASKFTRPGGQIALSVAQEGTHVAIRVSDNGIGIATDMLPRVFDMFTQADISMERPRIGLGIGLALVRGLVHLHDGTVEANSAGAGFGSEFIVRLPVALALVAPESPAADAAEAESGRCRILVVDDNKDTALSMAEVLSIMGNETRIAHDGVEAFSVAAMFQPDVIVMDVGMPRMNGYDAARRIRAASWGQRITLVALTGWGGEQEQAQSREAGFDHHMVKPCDFEVLRNIVDTAAATKRGAQSTGTILSRAPGRSEGQAQ